MNNWDNVRLVPEFNEQGVACYRLDGGDYLNEYYVVSEAETRKLLNTPEVVGYEVYNCLIPSTCQMLYYLKEQKKVTTANILSTTIYLWLISLTTSKELSILLLKLYNDGAIGISNTFLDSASVIKTDNQLLIRSVRFMQVESP